MNPKITKIYAGDAILYLEPSGPETSQLLYTGEEAAEWLKKQHQEEQEFAVYQSDTSNLISNFEDVARYFTPILAAGTITFNKEGKILMMFRKGSWDLPKGKADFGETISETAKRETQEETGLQGIQIVKELNPTCHVYFEPRVNAWICKTTYWFIAHWLGEGDLVPQAEEGITALEWMDLEKAKNIRPLYPLILNVLTGL
jgi:8-oxo-dGTP pyrophosphatase MutT (NUDIX family)